MPTEVNTLCFHTRDAVDVHDGSYTFQMPSDRLRESAVKVALASCEFPMVQWTVEEEWSRLWINEGLRLIDSNNFLDVVVRYPGEPEPEAPVRVRLPPHLNRIKTIHKQQGRLTVECEHEHGLESLSRGQSRLIGGIGGDVSIPVTDIRVQSKHSFEAEYKGKPFSARYLLVSTIPSPAHLCTMLNIGVRKMFADRLKIIFRYDGSKDRIVATGVVPALNGMVRILPTPLAHTCGISTHPLRFTAHTMQWPCEETRLWDYVEMPPGFYAPCHRPMCVGQPHRFGPELESAVNRFYFPLGGTPSNGERNDHMLVFSDPDGHVLTCIIPPGRYSPHGLARHLEDGMTSIAQQFNKNISFSVLFDEKNHFVFSCERNINGRYIGAKFGLLFNHPLCLDSARLGFDPQPATGSNTYVAPRASRVATVNSHNISNVIRVSEISSQKRFRFHAVAPPPMVGVVAKVDKLSERGVAVKTFVNKQPFAHGYQKGDVVRIVAHSVYTITLDGQEVEIASTSATMPEECSCLVRENLTGDPCVLEIEAPQLDGLKDENTCIQIVSDVQPWNMHFNKTQSIPPHLVGFRPGAVLWGMDGTLEDEEGQRLPPFQAPHSHCLDHPDYVLMTFSESSGASFEHSFDGESKHIFCKLSLYPLFREERMLPRDTTLLRNNLSRFTLSFWNPDMRTPYKFHGVQFSFSLSFISPVPEIP